jgi:cell cycle sensor histidine kinase DivJ
MFDCAIALVDRAGGCWLARIGGDAEVRAGELAILRRLSLVSAAALAAVPAGLSVVTGPAVALPAGFAVVLAAFLFSAVGSIALFRLKASEPVAAPPAPEGYNLLISSVAGLVLVFDPQGNVLTAGGRDQAEFLSWMRPTRGRGFIEQVHVSDRITFLQALDALRQGHDALTITLRVDRPTVARDREQFVHVRMDLTAGRDASGALKSIVAQLRDISGEWHLRDEAARKAAEAESANDAKSRFLAAVSHELRTPLNAILGFSDILGGEYFGKLENERQREYVALIRQSGAHLLSVVNTMLDMSKIEAGRYELIVEPFEIGASVRACEAMLALQAKDKGVTLASRVQRGLGEVVADQRAIQQILINLVGNAIKFTDPGGAITVDAMSVDGKLQLSVSDTGIGIAGDRLATLGQPFVQIQNNYTRHYDGTGLGLSLVKGLVALHGGSLTITSTPGKGTAVIIVMPLDGSGALCAERPADGKKTVDFPPRLKNAQEFGLDRSGHDGAKEIDDHHAQAKIA